MAETHRIGTFTAGGQFTVLLDVHDGDNIRVREFKVTPADKQPIYPAATRRYGGSRKAGEIHGNGQLAVAWILRDSSADEVLERWDELVALLESARADLFYEWRPGNATRSTFFRLRGGLPAEWDYQWWQFDREILQLTAGFVVAPLAYGAPMDVLDDFSTDTIGDYTFDDGTSAAVDITGGVITPVPTVVAYEATVLADSPVAYWRLGESSGTAAADETGTNAGTYQNTPTLGEAGAITGDADTSVRFTAASSEYVSVNDHASLDVGDVFTLEAWVKRASNGTAHQILSKGVNGYELLLTSTNIVWFNQQEVAVLATSSVTVTADGNWHHIVATKNGATRKVYVDGVDVTTGGGNSTVTNTATELNIGRKTNGIQPFDGWIDEVAVYPTALSAARVSAHYDAGTGVSGSFASTRAYHSGRGYTTADRQVTLKATPGSTISGYRAGVIVKRINATNYIRAYITDDGATSTLNLEAVVAGAGSALATGVALGSRVSNGTPFWVRARIEGNVVTGEYFTQEPYPRLAATSTIGPVTLSGSNATAFGRGVAGTAGWLWIPQHSSATLDDFRDEPYTYDLGASPTVAAHDLTLYGVPGTAPAEVAVESSTTANPAYGLIMGWGSRSPGNYVANGHFENSTYGTSGWSAAGVVGLTNAATSISRVTTVSKYGTASGEIVTPATADSGVNYPIYRRFRKGVTYTAVGWMQSAAGTTQVKLRLGISGDSADSTATALTTTFAQHTATWTPTADRDVAYVAAIVNAATATTFRLDGVMVYEGTTTPTGLFQTYGGGAVAPFGLLEAESAVFQEASATLMTATADATASGGYAMVRTAPANSEAWYFYHRLDPALLAADDFSDSTTIEFWIRYKQTSTAYDPTFTLRAYWKNDIGIQGDFVTTDVGARTIDADHTAWRWARIGALTFPVDAVASSAWETQLTITLPSSGVAGNFHFDAMYAVPARQRVAGKVNLTGSTANPAVSRLESDLTAYQKLYPGPTVGRSVSPGGQRIEFTPGTVSVTHKLAVDNLNETASGDGTVPAPTGQTVHFDIWPRYHITRSS